MNIIERIFEEKFVIDDRPAAFSIDMAGCQIDFLAPDYRFSVQVILVKE
jgi:hypothetical protein